MSCKFFLLPALSLFLFFNSYAQKTSFPYPVPENNFISFADTDFHCAYLKINEDNFSRFSFFISDKSRCLILPDENFIYTEYKDFFLMNFRLAFLTIKYNVVPYLHPDFAIKLLFLLNKVKYFPRISDAIRTTDEQIKYKKRGWSTVEDSPHMLGLAADLSYYTRFDRNIIQKYYPALGIRFLEHGGRGNNHIHLQDETLWYLNKNSGISYLSDSLNKKLSQNINILKPYAGNMYAENFSDGLEINFETDNLDFIKVEFIDPVGFKTAELTAGIFEKGENSFFVRTDFLKKGVYCARVFKNGVYLYQKNLIKN